MKRFNIIIILLLCFTILLPRFSTLAYAKGSIDTISAKAACLIEAESGKLIYGKNESIRMPMASTTKIMSAIIAIESGISLDTVIKAPKEAIGVEGSSLYLASDELITLEALLYGLLLCSANDAAVAIAVSVSGSVENFVALMNLKAQELGLSNTHFENPHGLDGKEHYTSARDLAKLMSYCINNETFLKISGTQKRIFPKGEDQSRVMINHNRLLRENIGVIAGKTGFTKKCGRCLVTVAQRNGMKLICVTLNAPNDWNDHRTLYDFGFSSYRKENFDAVSIKIPVISGNKSEILVKSEPFSLLLPNDDTEIQMRIEVPRFAFADIKFGEKMGRVIYLNDGKIIAQATLYACEDVMQTKYKFNLFEWLFKLFYKLKD